MLETVKAYLKIDFSQEDKLIETLINAAKRLILDTTDVDYNEADETYKLLVCYLVAHYYENRQAVSEKNMEVMPYTIQHLMAHIGVRGDYEPRKT
ncbi:MAG: head-tail connector protein [Candidatus Gastranaerophilales bacterium]|nr:head-tail connector protein [Candidatus Gastranaerophilales bacterium]